MPAFAQLDQRWRLLLPAGLVVVAVRNRAGARAQVRALPPGTPVAFVGGRRLRWLAWRSRVRVTAMYVALPSLATPVAITKLAPESLRWTARTVLTVPSGMTRPHALAWAAVRLVQAIPRLLGWLPAGDRIVVGTRS
ncbi:MAG TPA: hypothetical protein VFR67_01065 [Pilimelia sp.]|nr:hypothetical protein [Pilimelia sp.]